MMEKSAPSRVIIVGIAAVTVCIGTVTAGIGLLFSPSYGGLSSFFAGVACSILIINNWRHLHKK